jgi:hypothetical protein
MFPFQNELWCELVLAFGVNQRRIDMSNVIKKAAEKGVIHQVKNIRRAFGIKQKVNKTVVYRSPFNQNKSVVPCTY